MNAQLDFGEPVTSYQEHVATDLDVFITVPEVILPNGRKVPSFEVAKYVCSKNEKGEISVSEEGTPWTEINYYDAIAACEASGHKLLTETQRAAIAHDLSNVDENWTGGKVGKGALFQGLRKSTVGNAQAASFIPPDPDERRWMKFSNGEIIFDFAGHVWQWTFDDAQGDKQGVIAKPFAEKSISLMAPYPSKEKGVGKRPYASDNWAGDALIRGGCWYEGACAGLFNLSADNPMYINENIGFRCTP